MLRGSLTNRTQTTRSTSKQLVTSSQLKTVKQQNLASPISKSGSIKASSSHSTKNIISKARSENVITKSSDDSTIKKKKSREQAGYSEKRGLSTIYMPKSTTNKLDIKSNEKTVHRTMRDKVKLQDVAKANRTKPRMSSRERRKSRTLSPSEVKMLHGTVKKPNAMGKIKQNKNITQVKDNNLELRTDSDEGDYEYEDDFEVKKRKRIPKQLYYT